MPKPFVALNKDSFFIHNNQGGTGPNVVAIDNKIEQAMDLVKTHLMYAVREEVEVLRTKITDLEKKVVRLEKENAVLREHAPPEVIAQLLPTPPPPQAPSLTSAQPTLISLTGGSVTTLGGAQVAGVPTGARAPSDPVGGTIPQGPPTAQPH